MTVYNREKYLALAIQSVLDSTYEHWELIIVDDVSQDDSFRIAQEYSKKDQRINVYLNPKNLGDYPNRNQAASYAKGKYLKYIDADDLIYPYGLEQLVFFMEQFPDAGFGLCSLEQDKRKMFPFMLSPKEVYERHYLQQISVFHKAPLSSIIKRDVFESVGGFSGKRMLGDFEMWLILASQYNLVLMPHGIVWYREHNEQEMSLHRSDPLEPLKYKLLERDWLKENDLPLAKKDLAQILAKNKKAITRMVVSSLKHYSIKKANQLQKASGYSWLEIIRNLMIR